MIPGRAQPFPGQRKYINIFQYISFDQKIYFNIFPLTRKWLRTSWNHLDRLYWNILKFQYISFDQEMAAHVQGSSRQVEDLNAFLNASRMHSSRMHTDHCSGHCGGSLCPEGLSPGGGGGSLSTGDPLSCPTLAHKDWQTLLKKSHSLAFSNEQTFLPTAREGSVFRSICLLTRGEVGRPLWTEPPPGTDIWWRPLQQSVHIFLECILVSYISDWHSGIPSVLEMNLSVDSGTMGVLEMYLSIDSSTTGVLDIPQCWQWHPRCFRDEPECWKWHHGYFRDIPQCWQWHPRCFREEPDCWQWYPRCFTDVPECWQWHHECLRHIPEYWQWYPGCFSDCRSEYSGGSVTGRIYVKLIRYDRNVNVLHGVLWVENCVFLFW